ncbi:MAG: SDR family NAD(P)-dependent oxidoreductase [Alphaproteobacteria bacterium]
MSGGEDDARRGRTYWLVGSSEGLGRALAQELAGAGARLCLSARDRGRLEDLAAGLPGDAVVAPLDARDRASVEAAFAALPPLDGVIYCAGAYEPVSAEDWDAAAVETMFDVNLTGAARVLGAALPALVRQGRGHVVLIGSLAGLTGLPRSIGYGASKAGLICLAECMRADLPPDRFKVQVVNPGFVETRLTAKNDFKMPFLMSAEAAARRARKLMERRGFRGYFPWRFSLFFRLARLLPDGVLFPLMRAAMRR